MPSTLISPAAALRALYWGAALLLLAALIGPAVPQPQDFHAFADQRAWGRCPMRWMCSATWALPGLP